MRFATPIAVVGCSMLLSIVVGAQEPEAPQPTKHHELLKNDVGTWDAVFTFWPAGPDGPAVTEKAVEENQMIGGLWLVSEFRGEFSGEKFVGRGQFGYDPQKKKYVGTWIDSMTPYLSTMEGTYDAKTKTLTMLSTGRDPHTGKEMQTKNVSKYIDDDHRTFTMHFAKPDAEGEFVKMFEIEYERRKK